MGEIYRWGVPSYLLNTQQIQYEPQNLRVADKISQVSCGQSHYFILTNSNELYGFGKNSNGQLGNEQQEFNQQENYIQPKKFTQHRIVQVSCGWNHTLALDERGCVYSCGKGQFGALGNTRGTDSEQFKIVTIRQGVSKKTPKITQISAGKDHSLAISETKVYGWGNSQNSQLGLVKEKIYFEPQQLIIFHSYLCFAGQNCSIFCTHDGIYAAGLNENGKLGFGHSKKVKIPKKVNLVEKVRQIQDGSNYLMIQTLNHQYFLCGKGALGEFLFPTKIKKFKQKSEVYLGENFGIIKNNPTSIETWNFSKQPTPLHNQILSSLNIQKFIFGPKFIVGYSHIKAASLPSRKLMVKSAMQNVMHAGNIKRKQSDDLNHFRSPLQSNIKKNDEQVMSYKMDTNSIQMRPPQINYVRESLNDGSNLYSRQIEEVHERNQAQTPIFVRSDFSCEDKVNEASLILMESQEGQFGQTILEKSSHQDSSVSIQNLRGRTGQNRIASRRQQYELQQKINYLQEQNRKKDRELKQLRDSYATLLDIVESDYALKKIAGLRDPEYSNEVEKQVSNDFFSKNVQRLRQILKDGMQ